MQLRAFTLLAAALILLPGVARAEAPLYPTSRFLVPGMLEKGGVEAGLAWSGLSQISDNSRFQLAAGYGLLDRVDLAVRVIPDFGQGAAALAGHAGIDLFRPGNWTLGAVLGGSFSVGDIATYHYEHGTVRHGMQGADLDLTAKWKWLYFGMGGVYLRDERDYETSAPDPRTGNPGFAGKYPEYDLFTVRQFLGARFGGNLKFGFEVALMDPRVYNLWIEPSAPISSGGLTYGFALTWSPSGAAAGPEPKSGFDAPPPERKKPVLATADPSASLMDSRQYWRGVRFSALASLLGLAGGVAAGRMARHDEDAFFPPEMLYGMAGAVLAAPVGSLWGVYTDERYRDRPRPLGWTAAGTAAGFGAAVLLAPVTGGLSFYFAMPVGSVMGFRYGLRD